MELDLLYIAIGLAFMGHYIGKGLQYFRQPENKTAYTEFIKEADLGLMSSLTKEEMMELLKQHPNVPKVELNGTVYYPKHLFLEWLSAVGTVQAQLDLGKGEK